VPILLNCSYERERGWEHWKKLKDAVKILPSSGRYAHGIYSGNQICSSNSFKMNLPRHFFLNMIYLN
jgi:hypothetical protein